MLERAAHGQRIATLAAPQAALDPGGAALAVLASDPRTAGYHRPLTATPVPAAGPGRCAHPRTACRAGLRLSSPSLLPVRLLRGHAFMFSSVGQISGLQPLSIGA